MPKYDVHTYAIVRVKVTGIEAHDPSEAAMRADELLDLYEFRDARINCACEVEWAEDVHDYLVDAVESDECKTFAIDKHHRLL